MTLVHAFAWRYLIRGTLGGFRARARSFGSCSGPNRSSRDLVVVVGAVDAVDDGASVQVTSAIPGVDEGWTNRWTTAVSC